MQLTAEKIEAFAGIFLSPLYDNAKPTPNFHREMWELYCSDAPAVACAAPRGHAKSTALTHVYVLSEALFRDEKYIIILGSSEELASESLGDISSELHGNDDLIREFGIKRFITDAKTDIIVECDDGYQFRIIARGSEQKIRGRKWRGTRPGLIVFDDMEEDEQVDSPERRTKFRRWFFRAAKQSLRDGGKIRGHGTILHDDSLLMRLMRNKTWTTRLYKAHESYDDFSNILWPEQFPEAKLRGIRAEFEAEQDASGYAQEYLNDPLDSTDRYLRREDFIGMKGKDYEAPKVLHAAIDFALSTKDHANRTSITIGGVDTSNILHFIDQHVDKWDSLQIIDEMFAVQKKHEPEVFHVENGQAWLAIKPVLYKEMRSRNLFINIEEHTPISDKAARGRAFQKRMRAQACRFDKEAPWYPAFENECLKFTGVAKASLDDQFDSAALLCLGFEDRVDVSIEDFYSDDDWEFLEQSERIGQGGRSAVTGY